MKIGIITSESFPIGMATTNRIHSLAKGLTLNGCTVEVLCFRTTEDKNHPFNQKKSGKNDGIFYEYTTRTIYRPEKRFERGIEVIYGMIGLLRKIKNGKYDVLITTTPYFISTLLSKNVAKIKKIPIIMTVDEYPHVVLAPEKYNKLFSKVYLKEFYKSVDGFVAITDTLLKYYKKIADDKAKFVHIPMTVDIHRFEGKKKVPVELEGCRYIAYCGKLGLKNKDGVPILIEAFEGLKKEIQDIKLVIIGSTVPSEIQVVNQLKKLVKNLQLENDVIFAGKKSKEIVPNYLCNAEALVLARPDNLQAKGGFPTKLGEYLATGKPVVVTEVGEIPRFLNETNAFMAKPGNIVSIKDALKKALTSSNASSIGKRGKKVAYENFAYEVQSKRLFNFIEGILRNTQK